ncbi:transmembrane and coiled-coil domain-containing protein 1 homolog [Striga asiatica]|uniref:Transmembrane and coiled-coil domain-containing protein 1 homolog n=1 Tax=Striga asiatica TaxID=4170 RepID=A0A5A7PD69_STRAF|nr:transmembrane and coiled-coil domain-containing protein 1 homolog [Striga asiatica]
MAIKVSELDKVQDLHQQTQSMLELQTLKCQKIEKKLKIAKDQVTKLQRMFKLAAIWIITLITIILILVYSKRDNHSKGYIELGRLNFVGCNGFITKVILRRAFTLWHIIMYLCFCPFALNVFFTKLIKYL